MTVDDLSVEQLGECLICGEPVLGEPGAIVQRFEQAGLDDVYYCPEHASRVRQTRRQRRQRFRLTQDERSAIFAGEHPRIERAPGDPQAEVGEVVILSPQVTITITRKGRNKKTMVQYRYTINKPDRKRLLRQTPPAHRSEHDEEDRRRPLTPALEALAAEESAYTSSNLSAVPNEPENTDDPRALAASARLRGAQRVTSEQAEELAKKQARSVNEAVRDVLIQRARLGLPPESPAIAALQRAVAEAQAEIEEAA